MRTCLSVILACLWQLSFCQEPIHIWDGMETKAKSVTLTPYIASPKSSPEGKDLLLPSSEEKDLLLPYPDGKERIREESLSVIICPGGSYCWHDMKTEGSEVARWLQANGISAFVLKYRVQGIIPYITHSRLIFRGHQHPDMTLDLERAIQYVREHASQFGINPHQLGVMGFSAGGHLALCSAEIQNSKLTNSNRPDFIAAIYPVVSMSHPDSHKRSRRALLGEYRKHSRKMRDSLSVEKHIPGNCPPVFLVNCKDDPVVKYRNSELLDSALTAQGINHRYIQYRTGGHGFGASTTKGTAECRAWKEEFLKWLKSLNI